MALIRNDHSPKNPANTTNLNSNQYMKKLEGSSDSCNCHYPAFLFLPQCVISQKFDLIKQYEATLAVKPTAFVRHPRLSQRDRYFNIRPWAHNMIQLKALEFPDNYVNASPITLGRYRESFIATQGPGPGDTILHFWQMTLQEKVKVIVMLTQCVEAGVVKCGVYIPSQKGETMLIKARSGSTWGRIECVTHHIEEWGEIRQLRVIREIDSHISEEHVVHHLLFMRWPDHQVPHEKDDQTALINLIKMSRQKMDWNSDSLDAQTPPRLIHCSAGVGRTGTFIALDHLLHELEENKLDRLGSDEDPILDTVRRLREQRMGLVQNVHQYALIYQILREKWELRHLHTARPASMVQDDNAAKTFNKRRRITETLKKGFQKFARD